MFEWKEVLIQEAFSLVTTLTESGEVLAEGVKLVWTLAIANPMLTFILGSGLIGWGFTTFRKAKRVVR